MSASRSRDSMAPLALMVVATCVLVLYSRLSAAAPAPAADPNPTLTAGAGAGWDVFAANGPLWGGILLLFIGLQTFLSRQHWLAQGRLLAALTGLALVGSSVINWHFAGAPSSGILTAGIAAAALFWHPTVSGTPARPTTGQVAGAASLLALVLAGAAWLQACTAPAAIGHTLVDCTKADHGQLVAEGDALLRAPSWAAFETDAIAAGATIGGCALLAVIDTYRPAPSVAEASATDKPAMIERVRAHFGGVTWQTASGPR